MFLKIDVLKNFAIFTGKQLRWSLYLIKLQAFKCFPVNIAKSLTAVFLQSTSGGCFCRCSVLHHIFKKTLLNILQLYIAFFVLKLKIILIRFHSLSFVKPLVVIRCITRCHSLSLVFTHCHSLSLVVTRCRPLSLVVPLIVTRRTTCCHSL